MILYLKLLQFGRVSSQFSGPIQLLNLFLQSIGSFLAMMTLLFVGFSFALMALNAKKAAPWANFWEAMLSMLYLLTGDIDPVYDRGIGEFEEGEDSWVSNAWSTAASQAVIVLLFLFIGTVFLLNLLVAVLNIEYAKLAQSARWRSEHAAAVRDLQLWESLFDPRAKWLYDAAGPLPFSPLQLEVGYDDDQMRWLLGARDGGRGRYWMHVMPPDNDSFWSTTIAEENSLAAVYEKAEDLRVLIRTARSHDHT
mmetsp:Transcript_9337/g.28267  ORF Transcript_9337/g.28267 Transcript_9337/m.28267 type:complete len:252 (+) Transcript_9337:3-758(+)